MTETYNRGWKQETIIDCLSYPRFESYLTAVGGDNDKAFKLYKMNQQLSAILQHGISLVEVATRNAFDKQLVHWGNKNQVKGGDWLNSDIFHRRDRDDIEKAISKSKLSRKQPTHSDAVVQLNFGFWRALASGKYHNTLWLQALHKAFPHGNPDLRQRREEVSAILQETNEIRNRIAHLEPIFRRDIAKDLKQIEKILSWVHPELSPWFKDTTREILHEPLLNGIHPAQKREILAFLKPEHEAAPAAPQIDTAPHTAAHMPHQTPDSTGIV